VASAESACADNMQTIASACADVMQTLRVCTINADI